MKKNTFEGFFITGTDTGIGKTYVSKLLFDEFTKRRKTTYMKPVQTGCTRDSTGFLQSPDLNFIMKGHTDFSGSYEEHVPYRFENECSPHLASRLTGEIISLEKIRDCMLHLSTHKALTLVEGAGGIMVPLSETIFMIDLIEHLCLPVILVTTPRLGTLNHTFLTLRLLHDCGVKIAGMIFNNITDGPHDYVYHDNLRMIREHTIPIPFLEVLHGDTCDGIVDFCDKIEKFI
jgi:dethiobiotin synthetase